jgi:hypothetical protein
MFERSRRIFAIVGILVLAAAPTFGQDDAVHARMKKDIFFLASPECEGRGVDTQGINKAADYLVNQFKAAGLKPGGKDGTWFQPFTVNEGDGKVDGPNTLTLRGPQGQTIDLTMDKDFKVLPMSVSGKVNAPIVFAGYGLTVPTADYDDFKGLDVAGKIVVVLRRTPRWDNEFAQFGGHKEAYAGFETKIGTCELHRAAAVIMVNDRSEAAGGDKFTTLAGTTPASVPVIHMRRGLLDAMLMSAKGMSLVDVEKDIDRDLKPRSGPLAGWSATLTTTLKRPVYACKNIIGVLEGAGPLANETIVIGAHYDHLGYGGFGSMAEDKTKKEIHPGADDNGSGTTTVVELARRFAAIKNRQGRRLVFILFSGEERGLYGSKHYCNKEPLFPLESTAAMLNLDMVGRLNDKEPKLFAEGVGTGKGFEEMIEALNKDFGFVLQKRKGGHGPSDHDSFCRQKVPVVFLWTGYHENYHKPSDTADRINIPGMIKVAALAEKVIGQLATVTPRPEYVYVAETVMVGGTTGPKMRVQFDYYDESNKGAVVVAVTKDGPGDKAGLQSGDRITAINGQPTPNFNTYMAFMRQQKGGVPLELTVDRKGKQLKLTVTPQ